MTKKFCFWYSVPLAWLFLPALLLPSRGFPQSTAIRCWEVGYRFPVYDEQGRVDTSVMVSKRLYEEGDLMMYAYSYGYATGVDGQQLTSGTGYRYFIYEKDSLSGIQYDDQHPELARSFGVDSLKRLMVPYLKQFDLFKKGVGRLVSTVSHAGSGQLEETYCDINWSKHPNHDSCYVSYSDRLNFLPREMSLDVTLDSLYQKRLCQFKMVVHPSPDQQAHRTYDRSEWTWSLEEVRNFDRNSANAWFSRYRHDVGAIHP